jgi:Collagen triple helix repeat (20 copies)
MAHKQRLQIPAPAVVPTHPPLAVTQAALPLAFNPALQTLRLPNPPVFSVVGNTLSGALGDGTSFTYTPETPPDIYLQSGVYDAATTSIVLTLSDTSTISVPLAALVPIQVLSSGSIAVSGNGTTANPVTAQAIISATAGNVLASTPSGLFVPTVAGPVGPAGAVGAIGPIGLTGPTGAAGAVGAIGPIGLTGPTGAAGAVGAIGPIGLTGPTGAAGAVGAIGPIGLTGPTGAAGAVGAIGPIGLIGATGPAGPVNDFWRSGLGGTTLPDGTADVTDTIRRNGLVGLSLDPLSSLDVGGSFGTAYGSFAAGAVAPGVSDSVVDLFLNATQAITLPAPNTCIRRQYVLRNATPVAKGILPTYRTIGGNSSGQIAPYTTLTLVSSGSEWLAIDSVSELAVGQTLGVASPIGAAQANTVVAFRELSFRYNLNAANGNLDVRSSTATPVIFRAFGEEYFPLIGAARNSVTFPAAAAGSLTAAANTGAWLPLPAGNLGQNELMMYTVFTVATSYEIKIMNFGNTTIHLAVTRLT